MELPRSDAHMEGKNHSLSLSIAAGHPRSLMPAFPMLLKSLLSGLSSEISHWSISTNFSLLLFPHPQSYIFYSYWFPNPHIPIVALPQTWAALTAAPCSPCQQRKWYLKMLQMFQREYLSNTSTFKYPEEQSVAVMSGTEVCSESRLDPTSHCP